MSSNDIFNLADGWLELESDPGLFTLLLEDMGVPNVQVEEIYDLQSDNLVEGGDAYGFILLFRWIEDRRSRRKLIEEESHYVKNELQSLFFAQQMVPNSCATHALVSILLNCSRVNLGGTLTKLKEHVTGIDDSETKGWAIGNCPELALAHNSHAAPRARRRIERGSNPILPSSISRYTGETFHFVSYVPHDGHLIELDGLKKWPIDHGMYGEDGWIEKFRKVIIERLGMSSGGEPDIRFALMAVVPDKKIFLIEKLKLLNENRSIAINALHNVISQHSGKTVKPLQGSAASKSSDSSDGDENLGKLLDLEEISLLEKQVEKVLEAKEQLSKKLKPKPLQRMISRTNSFDSTSAAESPFQSNPLLITHDYAKSPLMEGLDDNSSVSEIDDDETEELKRLEELKNERIEPAERVDPASFDPKKDQLAEPERFTPKELLALLKTIETDIKQFEANLKDEHEKRRKHKIDDCRRVHDYDEFITTFVSMLAEQNLLGDLLEHALSIKKPHNLSSSTVLNSSGSTSGSGNTSGGSSIKKLKTSNSKHSSGFSKNRSKSRGRPKKKY